MTVSALRSLEQPQRIEAAPASAYIPLVGDASAFASLTFQGLRPHLAEVDSPWCAIGSLHGDTPTGLALGHLQEGWATLHSIAVKPEYRRQGIASVLLQQWENAATARGAHTVLARYSDGLPQRLAFQSLLARATWSPPELTHYRLAGFAGRMGREGGAWRGVTRILQRGDFHYAPLQFTGDDNSAIDRLLTQPEAQPSVDPRKLVESQIPQLSCTIRRNGALIGWMVAVPGAKSIAQECGAPGTFVVEYKELYLDRSAWSLGLPLGAFYHSFLAQAAIFGEQSIATYQTFPGRPQMVNLTLRRFAPMAVFVRKLFCSQKVLAPPASVQP